MSPVRPVIASQASGRNPARYSIGHSAPYSVADGSPECHCSTELIPSYPFSKLPIQTPSPVYSPVHGVQYTRVTGLVSITSVDKLKYEGCGAGHLTSCTTFAYFSHDHKLTSPKEDTLVRIRKEGAGDHAFHTTRKTPPGGRFRLDMPVVARAANLAEVGLELPE